MIPPRKMGRTLTIPGRTGPYVAPPPQVLPNPRPQQSGRPLAPAAWPLGSAIVNRNARIHVFKTWAEYEVPRKQYIGPRAPDDPMGLEAGDCFFGDHATHRPTQIRCLWIAIPTANGKISELRLWIIPPGGSIPAGFQYSDTGGQMRPAIWTWNGDEVNPTLTPSIRHGEISSPWYWHGYLRDGMLIGCIGEHAPA